MQTGWIIHLLFLVVKSTNAVIVFSDYRFAGSCSRGILEFKGGDNYEVCKVRLGPSRANAALS